MAETFDDRKRIAWNIIMHCGYQVRIKVVYPLPGDARFEARIGNGPWRGSTLTPWEAVIIMAKQEGIFDDLKEFKTTKEPDENRGEVEVDQKR